MKRHNIWLRPLVMYLITLAVLGLLLLVRHVYPSTLSIVAALLLFVVGGSLSPLLYRLVSRARVYNGELCAHILGFAAKLNCPMKRLFVHTSPTINAHAIGFGRGATILFTSAILENIPATELDALVAHEVAHHINCDWVTYALYIAVVLILDMLFVPTVLGTIIAAAAVLLSGLSLSRWREHRADVFVKERTSLGPALAELLSRVALNARALGYTSTEYSPALNVFSVHYSIPERIQFLRS